MSFPTPARVALAFVCALFAVACSSDPATPAADAAVQDDPSEWPHAEDASADTSTPAQDAGADATSD